jgi:hypothetical protein
VVAGQDAVACDDVVDFRRVEAGALRERGEALGEQRLRVDAVQGAVGTALAAGCANGVDDPGVDVELPSVREPVIRY